MSNTAEFNDRSRFLRLLAGLQQLRQEWKARSGSTTFHQAACGAFKLCAEELNDILATLIGEAAPRPQRLETKDDLIMPDDDYSDFPVGVPPCTCQPAFPNPFNPTCPVHGPEEPAVAPPEEP